MSKIYLTKEAILNAKDIGVREVEVPEWGGVVLVRGMTGRERQEYEEFLSKGKRGKQEITPRFAVEKIVATCTVDQDGNRLFTDEELALLSNKSIKALMRIATVAMELSGLTKEDMEEMVENFSEVEFTS